MAKACSSYANMLDQPVLYFLKFCIGPGMTGGGILGGFSDVKPPPPKVVRPKNVHDIYQAAYNKLSDNGNVLNNMINCINQTQDHVDIHYLNYEALKVSIIRAKHLIISVAPDELELTKSKLPDGHPFTNVEALKEYHSIFTLFNGTYQAAFIADIPQFHPNLAFMDTIADKERFNIPSHLGLHGLDPAQVYNTRLLRFRSYQPLYGPALKEAAASVAQTMAKLSKIAYPNNTGLWVDVSSLKLERTYTLNPSALTFSGEDIAKGAYAKLNSLQGKYRTWWTHSAFNSPYPGKQWQWIEEHVLPRVLEDTR